MEKKLRRYCGFVYLCLLCFLYMSYIELPLWSNNKSGYSLWTRDGRSLEEKGEFDVDTYMDIGGNLTYEERRRSLRHRRCGWKGHGHAMRPCPDNDTYCGHWNGRFWAPLGCEYDDVRPHEARKCVGNRTIAFIGDSQIRDIAVGVAFLLMGIDMSGEEGDHTIGNEKIDKSYDLHTNGTRIENFDFWSKNVPPHNYNGHTFPQKEIAETEGWVWQVQMWSLYSNEFIRDGHVEDILSNKMSTIGREQLRKIDFGFWSHGLHDWGWWQDEPYGVKYYDTMVNQWITKRETAAFPTVWVSMNPECEEKLSNTLAAGKKKKQVEMVEEANKYVNERMLQENLPYWDAAAVLRSATRCDYSADGLHVKQFVDNMRAKMLFNHLCDHEFNWKGDINHFT